MDNRNETDDINIFVMRGQKVIIYIYMITYNV